ncbi:hypothetical protein Ddye_027785 [Dipteronia dyeriana]|uniref:HMA domain-containing protein n=1 Tax=Dipteronia dyeriana TaxID=168575 RepID=A0AAD9WRS2_9ROSI|nr:hypothetical protein Ddye_027785 [Dipteronia dyeriana]
MKQKIVIKVQMPCAKCRSKAMKIAATKHGVTKVEIQGKEKDELVVIGDKVDSVSLARSLTKKLHYAYILSIEEEKEKKEEKKDVLIPYTCYPNYTIPQVVYDPDPGFCTIM